MTAWFNAGDGFELSLAGDTIRCRNADGVVLRAIPSRARRCDAFQQLTALRDRLRQHAIAARDTATSWMMLGHPVPASLLRAVWPDPRWRDAVRFLFVADATDATNAGILVDVDPTHGLQIADRHGVHRGLEADAIRVPHPIDIDAITDVQGLLTALGATQAVEQAFRATYRAPEGNAPDDDRWIGAFDGAPFEEGRFATQRAARLGYRVRLGSAELRIAHGGRVVVARLPLQGRNPLTPSRTGPLYFESPRGDLLAAHDVPAVACSEGVRMAARIASAPGNR